MGHSDSRKYGVPFYCGGWVLPETAKEEGEDKEKEDDADLVAQPSQYKNRYVVFGGGGGEARSGIKNSLLLAASDAENSKLSDPLFTLPTTNNTPYRMVVHPNYQRMLCAFEDSCRLYRISKLPELQLEAEEFDLSQLQGAGQQLALTFNSDGNVLATGGEDGHLRIFKWPSMETILDQPDAHKSIKDLDFSLDGSVLASTGDGSPCRIWDISNANPIASLPLQRAGLCRFSRDASKPYLFIVALQDGKSYIMTWSTTTWSKVESKKLGEIISAFDISPDGKLLALGSNEGGISILDSKMDVLKRIKQAHMIFVTAVVFSPDSRALLSISGDSSARVTFCETGHQQASSWRILPLLSIMIGLVLFIAVILQVARSFLQNSLDFVQDSQVSDMFVDLS